MIWFFQGIELRCRLVQQFKALNQDHLTQGMVLAGVESSLQNLPCTHPPAMCHIVIHQAAWARCNLTIVPWVHFGDHIEVRCSSRAGDRSLGKTLILHWLRHTWRRSKNVLIFLPAWNIHVGQCESSAMDLGSWAGSIILHLHEGDAFAGEELADCSWLFWREFS